MSYNTLRYEVADRILTLTLNRPDNLNAFTVEIAHELIDAYNHYFYHYDDTPLLVIDTRYLDFLSRPEDFEELISQLQRPIKGTEYFVPTR